MERGGGDIDGKMIETSDTYKRLLAANARAEVALTIGRGPVLAQENGKTLLFGDTAICAGQDPDDGLRDDQIESITITQRATAGGDALVGGALSGEIDVVLWATDLEIPRQAQLRPYVRLTDGAEASEWIPQGVFFVDTREMDSPEGLKKLTLHGYDAMLRGEQDYPETELAWPAVDTDVVREIAGAMRVQVDERTGLLMYGEYRIQQPTGYSCREVLSEIAGMYGGNFVISAEGKLLFVPLWGREDTVDISGGILGDYSTDDPVKFDAVELDVDDVVYLLAGPGQEQTLRLDCWNGTLEIASDLADKLQVTVYQPFAAKTVLLDPAAELGDRLQLPGGAGVLLTATRSLGAMYSADLESPATEDINHEYPFYDNQTRREDRRYQALSTRIDDLSSRIRSISANS